MTVQANPDILFINDLLGHRYVKVKGEFNRYKFKKAVNALRKRDKIDGLSAEALMYTYFGDNDTAIAIIDEAIKENGYHENMLEAKFIIMNHIIDTDNAAEEYERWLSTTASISEGWKKTILSQYLEFIKARFYFGEKTEKILADFIGARYAEVLNNEFQESVYKLRRYGISVQTYRKVFETIISCIYDKYFMSLIIKKLPQDVLNILVVSPYWSQEGSENMMKTINEEIGKIEDIGFCQEAKNINIVCIKGSFDLVENDEAIKEYINRVPQSELGQFNFNLERMKERVEDDFVTMPNNFNTQEEIMAWLEE